MEEFMVGQKVTWTSQAGGYTKTKIGKIFFVVDPEMGPWHRDFCTLISGHRRMFDGLGREDKSYLVEIPSKSGRGKLLLYWPKVKDLKAVAG